MCYLIICKGMHTLIGFKKMLYETEREAGVVLREAPWLRSEGQNVCVFL